MKSYPRIAQKLFSDPWAVMPETLMAMCDQFTGHTFTARADADDKVGPVLGVNQSAHPQVEIFGALALVRVHGILGKHLDMLEMQCGGCDVGLFQEQIANITDDPSVRAVVIDFRSPGGQVTGISSAVEQMEKCRQSGKKLFAYTSDTMASAAYFLGCACDEIHAEQSARIGSISTIISGVDNSKEWEMEGKVRKVFATGEFKAIGMSGKPWTEAEEAHIWEKVNAPDKDFKDYVRSRRGLPDSAMQGQWWEARYAAAGVVDSITFSTLSAFIESVYSSLH